MNDGECAAQRYTEECGANGEPVCEEVLQALRTKQSLVTAKSGTVTGLLSFLQSDSASFVERVCLPNVAHEQKEQISQFVRENASIKELDLTGSTLGNAGVLSILLALRSSTDTGITALIVADVGLSKKGARDVAVLLESTKFTALKSLNLTLNCMDNGGLRALRKSAATAGISIALEGNLCLVENLNALTHGVGATSTIFAGWFMIKRAMEQGTSASIMAGLVLFVLSLFTMMTCSCLYHASHRRLELNKQLRKADHCGVFLLIAGSYTPFTIAYILDTAAGPLVLFAVWACTVVGLLVSTGVVRANSTVRALFALAIGWIGAIPAKLMYERMQPEAIALVLGGGIAYSLGLIFYFLGKKRIPMMHVVWHLAVMLGGSLHYVALWRYVLTSR